MKIDYSFIIWVLLIFVFFVVTDYLERGEKWATKLHSSYFIEVGDQCYVKSANSTFLTSEQLKKLAHDALDQDSASASYALGQYYIGKMEPEIALSWFRLAELQGSKKASNQINLITLILNRNVSDKLFKKLMFSYSTGI